MLNEVFPGKGMKLVYKKSNNYFYNQLGEIYRVFSGNMGKNEIRKVEDHHRYVILLVGFEHTTLQVVEVKTLQEKEK